MFSLLSKIPVKNREGTIRGLLATALMSGLLGLLAFGAFSEASTEKCDGHLWWRECVDVAIPMSSRLANLAEAAFLIGIAALCAIAAFLLSTRAGNLKQYLAVLDGVESRPIQEIADITGHTPAHVRKDLREMIESEMITDFYIDTKADRVVSKKYIPKTSHKTVVKCSECGGNNELIVGITRNCDFCGQPLLMGNS